MQPSGRILFCNCIYAQVVPEEVKAAVLRHLCASGASFDAVPDLCEMAARRDPALARLAEGPVKIAACYPRAVKWLLAAAGVPPATGQMEVLNMRIRSAADVCAALDRSGLEPNLPDGTAQPPPDGEKVPDPPLVSP